MITRDLLDASNGNPRLRDALVDLQTQIADLQPPDGPPPKLQFSISGVDGTFIAEINLPQNQTYFTTQQRQAFLSAGSDLNPSGSAVTHQLQSALNFNFDDAGDVRTYGPSTNTRWEITDTPDQTRYWRLRSSYDGGTTWNDWTIYEDPILCGVTPVWSSQVRSTSMMPQVAPNVTNFASVDSVVNAALADIRVYGTGGVGTSWFRQVGLTITGVSQNADGTWNPFPSALLPGFTQSTVYDVYYDRRNAIYRVFTVSQFAQTLGDEYVFAGRLTTVHTDTGAGTGGTGGGGGAGGGETGDKKHYI